jgi:hypothetical protein
MRLTLKISTQTGKNGCFTGIINRFTEKLSEEGKYDSTFATTKNIIKKSNDLFNISNRVLLTEAYFG